jgi:hypothetical protein
MTGGACKKSGLMRKWKCDDCSEVEDKVYDICENKFGHARENCNVNNMQKICGNTKDRKGAKCRFSIIDGKGNATCTGS